MSQIALPKKTKLKTCLAYMELSCPATILHPIYHASRHHRAGDCHTNLLHRSAMLRLEATTTTTFASVSLIHLVSHLPKAATE